MGFDRTRDGMEGGGSVGHGAGALCCAVLPCAVLRMPCPRRVIIELHRATAAQSGRFTVKAMQQASSIAMRASCTMVLRAHHCEAVTMVLRAHHA